MYTIDQIRLDMQTLKQNGKSWRYIGKHYNIQPSMARLILLGHEPGKKVRKILNLPQSAIVNIVSGTIPDNTQALNAVRCSCGQWFITNHPRRFKCFSCSPYKGSKSS
jgi:hypothetical protein